MSEQENKPLATPPEKSTAGASPSAPQESPKANFFLRRPVLSMVLSIFIVLAGLLSIRALPIAQYPDLIPPTITVSAQYPGPARKSSRRTWPHPSKSR